LTYDPNDNLIYKSKEDPFGAQNLSFEYDELDQLTYEETNGPCHLIHDSLNNRVQKNETTYRLNDLNQIEGEFTYDANGNTIRSSDTTYTYDALDRLIALKNIHTEIHYTYDPFHRRITAKTGHEETTYLYIGNNEVGSTSSSGTEEFRVLGKGLGAEIGAAVLLELNGQVYAPIHDHSGSVVCLIDPDSGNVKQAYRYTPFGELINTHSNLQNPWRFASKRHDPTKLIFFGRRYYKPTLGRWITCDPLGLTDGPNLYAYVHNNPLTHFDEYGLMDDYGDWDAYNAEVDYFNSSATQQMAVSTFTGTRDFFYGSTCEFSSSIYSEIWGDPNDPNRVTPFTQRGYAEMGLLVGGTAIEVVPATAFVKWGGKLVYYGGRALYRIPAASKAANYATKVFNQAAKRARRAFTSAPLSKRTVTHVTSPNPAAFDVPFKFSQGQVILDKPSAVIRETYGALGNITSKYELSAHEALVTGEMFLGGKYNQIGKPQQSVFRSQDGLRQFRFDPGSIQGLHKPNKPHVHLETFNNETKKRIGNNHVIFYE